MKLTARGRYAVTAMVDLAMHEHEGPTSLSDISDRQTISLPYLEQLFAKLKKSNLVDSVRGPGGGYQLSRSCREIFIADIVVSVNEQVDATRCAGKADCQGGETCLTHELWSDLSEQIHNFLSGIDLASLVGKREIQKIAKRQSAFQDTSLRSRDKSTLLPATQI